MSLARPIRITNMLFMFCTPHALHMHTYNILLPGVVPALPHTVPSLYAEGLFIQHPNSSGQVYNVNNWCMQT